MVMPFASEVTVMAPGSPVVISPFAPCVTPDAPVSSISPRVEVIAEFTCIEPCVVVTDIASSAARMPLLGHLWMEGQLGVGDLLVNQGAPTRPLRRPATDSARKS